MKTGIKALAIGAALAASTALAAPAVPACSKAGRISAPDGGWDFASWDSAHQRLLIAHGKDVLVIDPAHPQAVRAIGSVQGAHGVIAIPDSNNLLVTSGKDNTVRVIDQISGKQHRQARPPRSQGDTIVLEPQMFPDTVNRPESGSARLEPGQADRNSMTYRFSVVRKRK